MVGRRKTFPLTNTQFPQAGASTPQKDISISTSATFGQHRELPFTQRHRNTNTSVCKRILRSQVRKGIKVLFLQSQFSQGKLNWHELLKTSWAQDHLGTEKKTEARIPTQSVSCRACALTSPPYRCLLASLSAISVLPESTYLEHHLPQPIFTVISAVLLSHSHDHRKVW